MKPIDIIILSVIVGIVLFIIGIYVYKRVKKLPTGECSCCKSTTGAKRMFKSVMMMKLAIVKAMIRLPWESFLFELLKF